MRACVTGGSALGVFALLFISVGLAWAHGFFVGKTERFLAKMRWRLRPRPDAFRMVMTSGDEHYIYADFFRREGDLIVFRSNDADDVFGPIVSAYDAADVVRVDLADAEAL